MRRANIVIPTNLPLPEEEYVYVGVDTEYHICGEFYTVVSTGFHWCKELGYVIWITTEEDKNTRDVDYCMSISPEQFKNTFKRY